LGGGKPRKKGTKKSGWVNIGKTRHGSEGEDVVIPSTSGQRNIKKTGKEHIGTVTLAAAAAAIGQIPSRAPNEEKEKGSTPGMIKHSLASPEARERRELAHRELKPRGEKTRPNRERHCKKRRHGFAEIESARKKGQPHLNAVHISPPDCRPASSP